MPVRGLFIMQKNYVPGGISLWPKYCALYVPVDVVFIKECMKQLDGLWYTLLRGQMKFPYTVISYSVNIARKLEIVMENVLKSKIFINVANTFALNYIGNRLGTQDDQ